MADESHDSAPRNERFKNIREKFEHYAREKKEADRRFKAEVVNAIMNCDGPAAGNSLRDIVNALHVGEPERHGLPVRPTAAIIDLDRRHLVHEGIVIDYSNAEGRWRDIVMLATARARGRGCDSGFVKLGKKQREDLREFLTRHGEKLGAPDLADRLFESRDRRGLRFRVRPLLV